MTMISAKYVLVTLASFLVLVACPLKVSADSPPATQYDRIVIVGVVFCTSAMSQSQVNYTEATPIIGASVRIACLSDGGYYQETVSSGENGYFYLDWADPACFDPAICYAWLDWSPSNCCKDAIPSTGIYGGAPLFLVDEEPGNTGIFSPHVMFYRNSGY